MEELTRLRFNDVNIALANTVEALENGPSQALRKNDINKIMQETIAEGTKIVKHEMHVERKQENKWTT